MDPEEPTTKSAPTAPDGQDFVHRAVDDRLRRVTVTLRGHGGMREWAALLRRAAIAAEPQLGYDRIIDATDFTGEWSATEIRGITDDLREAVRLLTGRIAVVAPTDARHAMWHMFTVLVAPDSGRVRLCRRQREALAWLAAPPGTR